MPLVLCSVIEHGSETEWDSVWNIIISNGLGDETWQSIKALSCTKQPNIMNVNLQISIKMPPIQSTLEY